MLKSHYFPTVERAQVVRAAVPGIRAFGSVSLNHSVGGINPTLVHVAGKAGARVVWMPTVDAENERSAREPASNGPAPFWAEVQRELLARGVAPEPITILDATGRLKRQVVSCLELIAEYDMVLATGHLSGAEISVLVEEAVRLGVRRILVTHALFPAESLSVEEQRRLAAMGAFIEHCYTTFYTGKAPWELLYESIRAVGPERSVISTNLGQKVNPPIAEGFADFAQRLLDAGFSPDEVRTMAVTNPRWLVDPEHD